ncbi:MAG: SpoIIE family protein phosphatase [Spirochaetales bacterium]|nr:SpoIIE family protein phosphatase [Spirochaetales bacterium]
MRFCVEVNCATTKKFGQAAFGDTFVSKKVSNGKRVIAVLSDGLGSGIKAGVLSSLTATAALNTVEQNLTPKKTAELIYRTLPECSLRKISYSTFTIADIIPGKKAEIVEFDNPPYLLIREGKLVSVEKSMVEFTGAGSLKKIYISNFTPEYGDRIVFISDGVTQSGMGTAKYPLGWGIENFSQFILGEIAENPEISARDLSEKVLQRSIMNDIWKAKDDITCSVIYVRKPRNTLILTGPPYRQSMDSHLADSFSEFDGSKIICGGTTAQIIARELNRQIDVVLKRTSTNLPPPSVMEGADYVSEGILTLCKVAEYLEDKNFSPSIDDPASKITEILKNSDQIKFIVGTRINEAHQDPNMPVELEIRRNIVKRICKELEKNFLKETEIEYI